MKKNKIELDILKSKSTQYSLLAGAFLLTMPACDDDDDVIPGPPKPPTPSLLYTDVDPDLLIDTGFIDSLDVNNDGVYDINMAAYTIPYTFTYGGFPLSGTIGVIGATPLNGAAISGSTSSANGQIFSLPHKLNEGETIPGKQSQWNTDSAQAMGLAVNIAGFGNVASYGNWLGQNSDKFLGLKVYDSGNAAHYAWVRLDTDHNVNTPSITVKDYSYEGTADSSIVTVATMRSLLNDDVNIYTANKNLHISSKRPINQVKIIKNGKEVLKQVLKNKQFKISLNEATGLHNIEIKINGNTIKKELEF